VEDPLLNVQQRIREKTHDCLNRALLSAGLIEEPIESAGSPEAKRVAKHATQLDFMPPEGVSLQGIPDGRFDEWTVVTEWVWQEDDQVLVLLQEQHKGFAMRLISFPEQREDYGKLPRANER